MIRAQGQIRTVEGPYAWVERDLQASCGQCRLHDGCGILVFSKLPGAPRRLVQALNLAAGEAGDRVEIVFEEDTLLRWSICVYIMPLLTMIGAALAAQYLLPGSEGLTVIVAFLGLACGFLALRHLSRSDRPGAAGLGLRPRVQRRLCIRSIDSSSSTA